MTPNSEEFPWEDVEAARGRTSLQAEHDADQARAGYLKWAKPCPNCGAPPERLSWFYFRSPEWTWQEDLCGRAGWMTVCDPCHVQVDFFMEVMS